MTRACVIGWPIKHSRSPMIHGFWLRQHGIEGDYVKCAVEPDALADFLGNLERNGFGGCNVTVPHKEAAFKLADVVDEAASAVQAANTLWLADGKLHASNTDVYGFMTHLEQSAHAWHEPGRPVALLGAGGAARAILYGLHQAGVKEIRLFNRTKSRAEELKAFYESGVSVVNWNERHEGLKDCTLVVNSTTLGMDGSSALDLSLDALPADGVVADIVYAPLETDLLAAARQKGCRTVDGLGMLLHQAVPGFERWFGVQPQVTNELRDLIVADLEE
ncbi:MAG: shikimate dehydrogenase [bacterium]|nr:shikimate dehydrogenase [bacterium]